MPNRLANETSPYLLQHQNNPVAWYPWGNDALEKSRDENLPIFLSIGYSACHWCHVMERESFESEAIAEQLRDRFVCIKVDREERPDLDQIYMNAVQMMTGQGGWPMTVFLTPDLKPFYAGTYFPPTARMNLPSFAQVIEGVHDAWENRRDSVQAHSQEVTRRLNALGSDQSGGEQVTVEVVSRAAESLENLFDFTNGGFGDAPKFPRCMDLQLLLRSWHNTNNERHLAMVKLNLDKMARGGIYDHIGGGFARYSVDRVWLVPHFEKMLYDNSLLAGTYVAAYQSIRDANYADVSRDIFDYILTYMTGEEGGFHSTEDADSEGEEGKFYVWTPTEIKQVLGDEAGARFCKIYDICENGNFEGKNIPNLKAPLEELIERAGWDVATTSSELKASRQALLAFRDNRVRPGKDDKVLANWNALMIDAMARGASALQSTKYLNAAIASAQFVLKNMRREDGRLLHSWRNGIAKFDAYLDDYAYFINALVSLYEATFDEQWIDHAVEFSAVVMQHFSDRQQGGFFYTADDHEQLITRNKDIHDSSVPSGSSMAATSLLRLGTLTGDHELIDAAATTINNSLVTLKKSPAAVGQMLLAADFLLGPTQQIVLVGDIEDDSTQRIATEIRQCFLPRSVIAFRDMNSTSHSPHLNAMVSDKQAIDGQVTLYVCKNYACQAPVTGEEKIIETLRTLK